MDVAAPPYSPEDPTTWPHIAAEWIGVAHDVGWHCQLRTLWPE